MLSTIEHYALNTLANVRGWRTTRQLIVIESDDWGAIRMRDATAMQTMAKKGLRLPRSAYDHFDCLERRSDLDNLFNVLDANRSGQREPPVFTFNTVMGNPNFHRIKDDNFTTFSHEDLFQSYLRYHGDDLRPCWNQAIQESLMKPQFHAREHLNVDLWLTDLRKGHPETTLAFDYEFYALSTNTSSPTQHHYLAAYWPESRAHLENIRMIVSDGLSMFERAFGFRSRSFIACNYLMPQEVEAALSAEGIELIQGKRSPLKQPIAGMGSAWQGYTGFRNHYGQLYSARNVRFEPFEDTSRDWVASAIKEIGRAFFWRTPAIVCTHRANYVGGLDQRNSDRNIKLLDLLLKKIIATWPDAEFITSDDLLSCMLNNRASS